MPLNSDDVASAVDRYTKRFREFGYSPKSLGYADGAQHLRYEILTSHCDLRGKSVLDVGCGFGDLNATLRRKFQRYRYLGIDINESFVAEGRARFGGPDIAFAVGEFLATTFDAKFDYVVESGVFNHRYRTGDNYEIIEACIAKAMSLGTIGLAFDFNSDQRPDSGPETFCASAGRVVQIAQRYSKNVLLRHDYMPYEFALFIFADDSFEAADGAFARYKSLAGYAPEPR